MSEKEIPKWLTDKYILNLEKQIESYFTLKGIPVTISVVYAGNVLRIAALNRTGVFASIPCDQLEALKQSNLIDDLCKAISRQIQNEVISLLNATCRDQHVIPSYKVKKYYLIYNPKKIDITKLLEVLAVEEL